MARNPHQNGPLHPNKLYASLVHSIANFLSAAENTEMTQAGSRKRAANDKVGGY